MSKLVYIIYSTHSQRVKDTDKKLLHLIEKRVIPDNITPNKMQLIDTDTSLCAIYNPVSTILIEDSSVCLGYTPNSDWNSYNTRGEDLEGSFAIFRNTNIGFQIANDMVASRTVWYYFDEHVFIASTSQRAIVTYLGSFEFNDQVVPWMLSSGTLGPGFSYDRRLKMVEPNSLITLNKDSWEICVDTKKVDLENTFVNIKEAKKTLSEALETVFNKFDLDYKKFVLPLSGGYDSRGILLFLKNTKGLRTITWGAKESRNIEVNDAFVANQLANKVGVENIFYESYNPSIQIEEILNRYLVCSEGRIDQLEGYLDGMQMWKTFFEKKYETIIRGEELIGLSSVKNSFSARKDEGFVTLSDYVNMDKNIIGLLPDQEIETSGISNIYKYKGELAFSFEHPIVFAALNDIKQPYTEVFSPLLSSTVIKAISQMFDAKIIGDKEIFKDIVNAKCPDIPIAKSGANKPVENLFKNQEIKDIFLKCFKNAKDKTSFDHTLIDFTIEKISKINIISSNKINYTKVIKRLIPKFLKQYITSISFSMIMDWNIFAFRLYILIKAHDLFNNDSKIRNS